MINIEQIIKELKHLNYQLNETDNNIMFNMFNDNYYYKTIITTIRKWFKTYTVNVLVYFYIDDLPTINPSKPRLRCRCTYSINDIIYQHYFILESDTTIKQLELLFKNYAKQTFKTNLKCQS